MAPLCACGAWGADLLARLGRVLAAVLALLLGTWACTSFASFWIAPEGAATHNWAGLQLFGMGRRAEAERSFRKAAEADPHFVEGRVNLAGMLAHRGDVRGALQQTAAVLRDDPDNADALLGKAAALEASGQAEEALAALRRAAQVAPDHPVAFTVLGGLLMRLGRPDEAAEALRQALRVSPSSPADHANLGLLLARAGRREEAVAQYRLALELRPDSPGLLADLAWLLATSPDPRARSPEEALRLAEAACRATRFGDLVSLQALAAAHAAGGRLAEALAVSQKAAEFAAGTGRKELIARVGEQLRSYERRQFFVAQAPLREGPYPPTNPRRVDQ
jgi:tetratricopeptide (TPR) repeat protein